MRVKFYEAFAEEERRLRHFLPKDLAAGFTAATVQESGDTEPPARLISIRTQSSLPAEWAAKLDGILTRSVGYDHLTVFRRAGNGAALVASGHLPDYCRRAVAEQALLLVMALRRKLRRQMKQTLSFNRDHLTGGECLGANLLVVGVGRIGGEVVKLGRALGMETRGVDIQPRRDDLTYVPLSEGLAWADVIVCALPHTPLTRGMLSARRLDAARSGLVLVNVGRGEVTPLADMAQALEAGRVAGVALDVYPEEDRLAADLRAGTRSDAAEALNRLSADDRVILTPHNAFNTDAAVERKAEQSVWAVRAFLDTGRFPDPVPDIG